jgi:4-hydroxybenzoate polyprenyltransferase
MSEVTNSLDITTTTDISKAKNLPKVSKMSDLLKLLRVKQWVKNLFVFAGLFFSRRYVNFPDVSHAFWAFLAFCMISSTVYIINDLLDIERDRQHPKNQNRPLASGRIKKRTAHLLSIATFLTVMLPSLYFNIKLAMIVLIYFLLNLAYSFKLKHVVILDVFIIAIGFVLRVLAGTLAINIAASHWLLLCTFLLSLFLGFAKRRHEITLMGEGETSTRKVLSAYSPYFLDQMLAVITPSVFLTYVLYTVDAETVAKYGNHRLIYTTPFVIYGIFRYQYLVYKRNEGNPSDIVYKDISLILSIAAWLFFFLALTSSM